MARVGPGARRGDRARRRSPSSGCGRSSTRRSRSTRRDQVQAATLANYGGELVVDSVHSFRLAAEVPGRTGAVAVAALALVPLAGFAAKRRWGAFVLGGAVAVLALMLVPELFTRFSERRLALAVAPRRRVRARSRSRSPAGSRCSRRSVWVAAVRARSRGSSLERQWPGDFAYGLRDGGPGAVTWFALVGGRDRARARDRRSPATGRRSATASARSRPLLFVLPVAVHGFRQLDAAQHDRPARALAAARCAELQELPQGRRRDRVAETSYRDRRRRARLRRRRTDRARREHEGERPRQRGWPTSRAGWPPATRRSRAGTVRRWAVVHGRLDPPPVMKVLLVTLYFPPAGGGGVQRPLKFATHLPELGIETHVLAPDDPKWIHRDDELPPPTLAWVHRVRFIGPAGPQAGRGAARHGGARALHEAGAPLFGRRLLLPDENVTYNLTAIPAAIRIAREEGIDVVITTSPPPSVHFVGAAVKRATGARWIADLRDSLVAHPHRDAQRSSPCAIKEQGVQAVASLVARQADAIVAVSDAIAEEMRARSPRGPGGHDRERLRLRRLRRARVQPRRAVPDHARRLVLRQARPEAVPDRARPGRRRRRAVRRRLPRDRPRVGRRHRGPDRADPVRAAPTRARAPARLRGAAAPDPRGRRPRSRRALGEGVRVPRGRAPDPRRRPAGRRGGRADPRDRRRRRRRARRHRRDRARARGDARPLARGRARRLSRSTTSGASASTAAPASQELADLLHTLEASAGSETASRASSSSRRSSAAPSRRCTGTSAASSRSRTSSRSASSSRTSWLSRPRAAADERDPARLRRRLRRRLPASASTTSNTAAGLAQFAKGFAKFVIHFTFLALAVAWLSRRGDRLLLAVARVVLRRDDGQRRLRRPPARRRAQAGVNLDSLFISPLTGGASQINIYGAVNGSTSTGRTRSPATRTTSGSC